MSRLQALTKMWRVIVGGHGHESTVKQLVLVSRDERRMLCELELGRSHINFQGALSGGCVATLMDVVSSMLLYESGAEPDLGASADMNISFLKAGTLGEKILIEAEILKQGRNLTFLSMILKNKADGTVIAVGRQTNVQVNKLNPPTAS